MYMYAHNQMSWSCFALYVVAFVFHYYVTLCNTVQCKSVYSTYSIQYFCSYLMCVGLTICMRIAVTDGALCENSLNVRVVV